MEIPSERREDDVLLALTCEVSGDLGRLFEHVVKKKLRTTRNHRNPTWGSISLLYYYVIMSL